MTKLTKAEKKFLSKHIQRAIKDFWNKVDHRRGRTNNGSK